MKDAPSRWPVSAFLPSLPFHFAQALGQLRALGFSYVDVIGLAQRPVSDLEALADSGLLVSCGAIGRGLPEDQMLDAPAAAARRLALEEMKRQITDVARLGATHAYIVPGLDSSAAGLTRFAEACRFLADHAASRMVRLCVEHAPGRALPTAAAALRWLQDAGHDNLRLLLDVGHCLISGEDPAEAVRHTGERLGYVHLDNNDGVNDLHWPLLAGQLTRDSLEATLAALGRVGYQGAVALELHAGYREPAEGLRQGKALLEQLYQTAEGNNAG